MSASPARSTALEVLTRVREREAYAHETLDAVLGSAGLSPRDRAFATRIAYGAVAARGTLDEAVARYVTNPDSLEPRVGDALALGAYEVLFASTPTRAAVNETVELVRSVRPKAAGFANAVMRKLAAEAGDFPWGDPATDDGALARQYAHPLWLAQHWIAERGRDEAISIMEADNEPAPLYVAHLPMSGAYEEAVDVLARDGAEPEDCELSGCIRCNVPSAAVRSAALKRGLVVVVDAAAQLTVAAVDARPGQSVVEIGAGRGTKTIMLAAAARLAGGKARVTAIDLHKFKLDSLRTAAAALGLDEIKTRTIDATVMHGAPGVPLPDSADAVLVDAPCSGLGTLRRHPDRRWRAKPAEIEALAGLGSTLLEQSARLVKPGGFVVYSTCTIARRENEDVVAGFLDSEAGRGFAIDRLDDQVPSGWASFLTPEGFFQSLPAIGGPDGHFIARLKRA